ncbi:hypothetical protein SCLCIDRAFT_599235 [Scleroderma citrinum Foug A]|uniref:Uncharacterized protein n=1 Tax=Scleroderma citrinum Foug A TaxID=1036808 RepID=A0A0C3DWD2_9AGAM|nr:hypothetical protein SCLCIDRAFT_599235 [Scleroderma citrinum Foug A]
MRFGRRQYIPTSTIGAAIMIMRVHALYARSRCILVFLVALAIGVIGFGCWAVIAHPMSAAVDSTVLVQGPAFGCPNYGYITYEQALYLALTWSGQLVCDVVVFLLIIVRTLRVRKMLGNRSITDILLRDGSMYFGAMCVVNVANITVLLVAPNASKACLGGFSNVTNATYGISLDPVSHGMAFAVPPTGTTWNRSCNCLDDAVECSRSTLLGNVM